jgi:hypothetical protein
MVAFEQTGSNRGKGLSSGGDKRPKTKTNNGIEGFRQAGKIPSLLTTYFFERKINPHSVARLW